jgi:AraC-like DNA-binding protein
MRDSANFNIIRVDRQTVAATKIRGGANRMLLKAMALDVGFADQAHFTKRFKQLTGTTPALYARSMQ